MSVVVRWASPILLLGTVIASCGGGSYRPCNSDRDCGAPIGNAPQDTQCCRDDACRGGGSAGVCLKRCDSDRECPVSFACADDFCFFQCDDDRECARGFRCRERRGRLVCVAD
jgi:hypothetical protein